MKDLFSFFFKFCLTLNEIFLGSHHVNETEPMNTKHIEDHANLLYSVYCEAVGGVVFNGDPLTGSDTNDTIHQRGMEQIRMMMSDEF